MIKKVLSIAGSDCSGGAGIQADLKTFAAHHTYGMSVITSVVAENTVRVIDFENINVELITKQIDAVFEDIVPDAIKIGMLENSAIMECVVNQLKKYKAQKIVVDPVMYAKNGDALMSEKAIASLIKTVIPIAYVLTPNIPEASEIVGYEIKDVKDMEKASSDIYKLGCQNVLIKGGHLENEAIDILFDGTNYHYYQNERINTKNTHGTGCTLSSAIAANLALNNDVGDAIKKAKEYITQAISNALEIGEGHGPTNHFYHYDEIDKENR